VFPMSLNESSGLWFLYEVAYNTAIVEELVPRVGLAVEVHALPHVAEPSAAAGAFIAFILPSNI
jgi:hypothetical protein